MAEYFLMSRYLTSSERVHRDQTGRVDAHRQRLLPYPDAPHLERAEPGAGGDRVGDRVPAGDVDVEPGHGGQAGQRGGGGPGLRAAGGRVVGREGHPSLAGAGSPPYSSGSR